MSNPLGADEMLELLDRIQATVEDCGARARRFEEEYRARVVRETRRSERAIEEQSGTLTAMHAEAEERIRAARTSASAAFERRKTRIAKACTSSKEQALHRIDEEVGGLRYELQKKMLQAERDRTSGLAAANSAIEEFRRHLAAAQERLAQLERSTQRALRGYKGLLRQFFGAYEKTGEAAATDEKQLLSDLEGLLTKATGQLQQLRASILARIGGVFPAWLLAVLALAAVGAVPVLQRFGVGSFSYGEAGAVAAGLAVLLGVRLVAERQARPLAGSLSELLAQARRVHDACHSRSESHHEQEVARIKNDFENVTQDADARLKQAGAEAGQRRVACRMECDERAMRANTRNERLLTARRERIERGISQTARSIDQTNAQRLRALDEASKETLKRYAQEHEAALNALAAEWKSRIDSLYAALQSAQAAAERLSPSWDVPAWARWSPPAVFARAARFGRLAVDLDQLCSVTPKSAALALPGSGRLSMPLCLAYPGQGSILIETGNTGHDEAILALNNIILRLLTNAPAGRLNFTILDPVGLGQNFAGVMHLADYEEQIINSRIWTQSTQIEQKLANLNEHMEKVIQMYLRNEYRTIAEYNEQAGVIAEKYHFLVVADFPANFTDVAAKRLMSIAASGARCGVCMLIHWDQRLPLPEDFIPEELRKSCIGLSAKGGAMVLTGRARPGADLVLDQPPTPEQATDLIHLVGKASRDSSRVEVPFDHVAPPEGEMWTQDTAKELQVPIGRTGATKLQYLSIGKGTCQHGLIAGKTGSGKSTLFHVIITNLALWCSPEQVEFYLVDFKKGVEFKCYGAQRLPHARVVAIESDREFGLSVLQRVDDELKRRGDLFRQLGVQDIAGYKRAGGTEPIPRTLLMVDEFQEFFVEDDKISQTASLLLDRIVRQGRAFGIHVLLGSQTLGGAYTVARSTLGQMVIRIALQCNEADAYLIMDDGNPAPRLLSRPGEGLYNDMAGALEGNSPFQTVWLPEDVRDAQLARVRAHADLQGGLYPGPIVFEGNAPADIEENVQLRALFEAKALRPASAGRFWLGAPNSIKGPTEVALHRQSGNNLIVVGQRDEAILSLVGVGLLTLAAQYPVGGARFILCDATPPGTAPRAFLERVLRAIPHSVTWVKPGDLAGITAELQEALKLRGEAADAESAPPVFLFIHGLQKFGKFRYEEDFGFSSGEATAEANPGAMLNNLVCEGTRLGLHVVATCDTYNNVNRFLSRKAFSEFELRVLFQMSANDSASMIDNPKAGLLGLHRALLFNAQEGSLETFRPYALPSDEWIAGAGRHLARLLA